VSTTSSARLTLGGRSIHVLHDLKELDLDPAAAGIDVVVSGHSHRPKIETVGGVRAPSGAEGGGPYVGRWCSPK
jgi:predicted phosphodiesterase